jgi:hypothetical protein
LVGSTKDLNPDSLIELRRTALGLGLSGCLGG